MKTCPNCASENQDNAAFCSSCGALLEKKETTPQEVPPPPPPAAPAYAPPQPYLQQPYLPMIPTDGLAIASLVLSITSFFFLPIIGAILGIIFGQMSKSKIAQSKGALGGEQLAQAGVIIGWIHIGLFVLVAMIVTVILVAISTSV